MKVKFCTPTELSKSASISMEDARRVISAGKMSAKQKKEVRCFYNGSCYIERGHVWFDNGKSAGNGGASFKITK